MQTFLPYDDFIQSAKALDSKRLGKQRVEVLQILKAIIDDSGWIHHPATHMWRGHTNALVTYGHAIRDEWIRRGNKDTCLDKMWSYYNQNAYNDLPPWFGDENFHASHRSNLIRKEPAYNRWFEEDDNLPYCWPKLIKGKWHMRFKHAGAPNYILDMEYTI